MCFGGEYDIRGIHEPAFPELVSFSKYEATVDGSFYNIADALSRSLDKCPMRKLTIHEAEYSLASGRLNCIMVAKLVGIEV